jgi:hypothetical protein
MTMKKKVLLMVMLLMLLSVFALTGCTTNGNEFVELNKEIAMLPQYSYTGDMTMSFTFPDSVTENMSDEDAAIMAELKNMKFTLSGNYLAETMYQDLNMGYEFNGTKGNIRFVMDKTDMYINTQDMLVFLEAIMNDTAAEDIAATKKAFEGADWLKSSSLEGTEALGDTYNKVMEALFNNIIDMQSDLFKYTNTLNKGAFAEYKPNIFSKSGNAYVMNISEKDFAPVVKEFIKYIITNKTSIVTDTQTFITNNELAWLTEAGVDKKDVLDALEEINTDLKGISPEELAEFDSILDIALTTMDGSSFYMSLEERSANKYRERFDMNFALNMDDESMSMHFNGSMDINASAKVTANIPTENVKSTADIVATLTPASTSATIDASTGSVLWTKSYDVSIFDKVGFTNTTLKKVNGSYYLPLRQVGELLGEKATWDQKAKKAYLVANGKKYNLTGFNNNGTMYVKLREFEKVGYLVSWDIENQEIIITK